MADCGPLVYPGCSMALPIIAIVGRPNVGKSSLFNALARRRTSIVDATPGVTRDRVTAICDVNDKYFELVDTGGLGIVDRDDLEDGGASLFAAAISAIKSCSPQVKIEALIPDFSGSDAALRTLIDSGPDVIGHNIETVRRLSPGLRDPRADYDQSLCVLERVLQISPETITKSSIMLGLGEEQKEVLQTMRGLRSVGVRALTLGQYLQPSHSAAPLVRYVHPDEFAELEERARELGFCFVMSGPLVRSSYHAERTIPACSD